MQDKRCLGEEVSQANNSLWSRLNHFNSSDEELQALLRDQRGHMCILVDPVGNVDLHLSTMGIALPRIG